MANGALPLRATKGFPFDYDLHDFPNGLRLVTIPTDYLHVVAMSIAVQAGSRNEVEPGKRRSAAHKRLLAWLQTRRQAGAFSRHRFIVRWYRLLTCNYSCGRCCC